MIGNNYTKITAATLSQEQVCETLDGFKDGLYNDSGDPVYGVVFQKV